MYTYVYVHVCVYIYIHIYIYKYIYIYVCACVYMFIFIHMMKMIAFITLISSLVPLVEGLYVARTRGLDIMFTLFAFLFQKQKCVKEKKQLVQHLILPPSIYIHMSTSYTYTNAYMPRFSPSGFFCPSRCLVPTPGLTLSTPRAVCVCAYTHTYTHTHSHSRQKIGNTQTTLLTPLLSKTIPHAKNNPPRQATSTLHKGAQSPHPLPSTLRSKLHINERICTPCSECVANVYAPVKEHRCNHTFICTICEQKSALMANKAQFCAIRTQIDVSSSTFRARPSLLDAKTSCRSLLLMLRLYHGNFVQPTRTLLQCNHGLTNNSTDAIPHALFIVGRYDGRQRRGRKQEQGCRGKHGLGLDCCPARHSQIRRAQRNSWDVLALIHDDLWRRRLRHVSIPGLKSLVAKKSLVATFHYCCAILIQEKGS